MLVSVDIALFETQTQSTEKSGNLYAVATQLGVFISLFVFYKHECCALIVE